MATEIAGRPEPREAATQPVRRRGPMSPEEMIDLRNQELRVDEAMVRQLVEEAKADFSENLLEPVQAATSPWGVIRHRRRLLRVMGGTARLKTNGAAFLISVGLFAFFVSVMVYNPVYPWYFDVFAALLLTVALTLFTYVHGGYRQAFSRVYALERRDFTDPGYVTGWVRAYLPSLGFYYRPDVWRGNDGRNGAANPDSTVVLACGVDAVAWTYDEADPDWDSEVWCQVTPGSRIQDFRTPLDYFDLPADHFTTEPTSIKHRRAWCRDLLRSGQDHAAWKKGALGLMDGRWPWLAVAGFMIIGVFGMFMSGS